MQKRQGADTYNHELIRLTKPVANGDPALMVTHKSNRSVDEIIEEFKVKKIGSKGRAELATLIRDDDKRKLKSSLDQNDKVHYSTREIIEVVDSRTFTVRLLLQASPIRSRIANLCEMPIITSLCR